VIVDDPDVESIAVLPSKTDAPAIVDPNAVLPGTVALEEFQSVARRRAQILQGNGCIEVTKLSQRNALDVARQSPGPLAFKQSLRMGIGEALDHKSQY